MFKKFLILTAGILGGIALAKESTKVSTAYDAAKLAAKNKFNSCNCNKSENDSPAVSSTTPPTE